MRKIFYLAATLLVSALVPWLLMGARPVMNAMPPVRFATTTGDDPSVKIGGGFAAKTDTAFPVAEIDNALLHARCYLPDAQHGYYRGSRFDWSGVMPGLEYKGHSFCGQWFEKYDPLTHDAIMGPVEAFSPLGYEQAEKGGGFVKIGIGVLARTDKASYSPFTYYPLLNPGVWEVKKTRRRLEFVHRLEDTIYSYVYTKGVELSKGRPELVLTHSLKNTGRKVIETDVYDHNLFLFDGQSIGAGTKLQFPFSLTAEQDRGLNDLAALRGDSIVILRQPVGRESVYAVLHGYGDKAADYAIRLENPATGTGVRITCDRPLSRLVTWGNSRVLSPEPYIRVSVQPGETFTWKITYQFFTTNEN